MRVVVAPVRSAIYALTCLLPWSLRRPLLGLFFGYKLHPSSYIGFSWVLPRMLVLDERARIGHLTVCKGMDLVHLKAHATLGRLNWVSAYPLSSKEFFAEDFDRRPELVLGEHAAITSRHLIDCTASISVGDFSTIGGWRSQLLTHSVDILRNRQSSRPIRVGRYCFVGTDCVLLGGSALPDCSVVGAKSLVNHVLSETHAIYAGSPACLVKRLPADAAYFGRSVGVVN